MPDFLVQWLDRNKWTLIGILVGIVSLLLFLLWLAYGSGPRRRRELGRLRKLLATGAWQAALDGLRKLRFLGRPSASVKQELDRMEADCLRRAADEAMQGKNYEGALEHLLRAVALVGGSELEVRGQVQNAMLEDARKQFALTGQSGSRPIQELLLRAMQVQSPCREATFWIGMSQLRDGQVEQAILSLQEARIGQPIPISADRSESGAAPASPILDPALYLGAILLKRGQAKESLRFFTEANRLDPNCPLVPLHLGAAMIAAGGDAALALRAIQRALGPRGLGQWSEKVSRFWAEVWPADGKSYVRRLAEHHPFSCPLYGSDLTGLLRLGLQAQAQAYFRQGDFERAADNYAKLLKESAPTPEALRSFGIALAKLGKFDEAFPQLKLAFEQEIEKDRSTVGWLALCASLGTAASEDDRQVNLRWAIQMVSGFNAPRDAEWIALISKIFAEARRRNVAVTLDEQVYLCEHLASADAIDADAAQAYAHLQATYPQAATHEYAWLFCRAAQDHPVEGPASVALFATAFGDPDGSRAFFAKRGWNFDELERVYLERAAVADPGKFPAVLGADYAPRGVRLLLDRSAEREKAGDKEGALAAATTLLKLDPQNATAMDRAAHLQFRLGRADDAVATLRSWAETHPHEALPLVRIALIRHQQKQPAETMSLLRSALERTQGRRRAALAFLAGRLTLQAIAQAEQAPGGDALGAAQAFLEEGLQAIPDHRDGLTQLATVRALRGDRAGLAALAPAMKNLEGPPRFLYFAALAADAAQEKQAVVDIVRKLQAAIGAAAKPQPADTTLLAESSFLAAMASLDGGDRGRAAEFLRQAAQGASVVEGLAQAWAGRIAFEDGRFDEAAQWWQKIDGQQRTAWNLAEPLAGATFLAALDDYRAGRFEIASEKLRQAGKFGWRDRRLGQLLFLTLFEGGKHAIYGNGAPKTPAAAEERR